MKAFLQILAAFSLCAFVSTSTAQTTIRAYIDGNSKLVVQPDRIYWEHEAFQRPGRADGTNLPTLINGTEWFPEWPTTNNWDAGPSAPLFVTASFSSNGVMILSQSGNWPVAIVEQPAASNAFSLVLQFADGGFTGASWYEVTLGGVAVAKPLPAYLGDLDADGQPTVLDLVRLINHLNSGHGGTGNVSESLPEPLVFFADVNQDGYVNSADVDALSDIILGLAPLTGLPLTHIRESSPAHGEGGVAVTRETVFRFTLPLAANTLLTTNHLFATFGGRRILSCCELSSDRRTVTLFYLEDLPASARVRVTLNPVGLQDALGRLVDLDGDGQPGGVALVDFDTLNVTPLTGTAIRGTVYASDPMAVTNGSPSPGGEGRGEGGPVIITNFINRPLAGVTITVDGMEESLRAVTDTNGNFLLHPCPAGDFFVHIDGRTVTNVAQGIRYPDQAYYPFVGKSWRGTAGRTNFAGYMTGSTNQASTNGWVFLPLIAPGTLQPVSMTNDTMITFPSSVISNNPALAGVMLMVPANSLFSANGARGGSVGIAPVPPDRLPGVLPPGLNFPLVITVQTDGPENFDVPVPVRFPNLPDPITGQVLAPGEKTVLWSFNHDTGEWEPQGTMTVTADGLYVESDPGVGIRQPGWHEVLRAVFGSIIANGPPCTTELLLLLNNLAGCAVDLADYIPFGCRISGYIQSELLDEVACAIDPNECGPEDFRLVVIGHLETALSCVPIIGATVEEILCLRDEALAASELLRCELLEALSQPGKPPHNPFAEQQELLEGLRNHYRRFLGNDKWTAVPRQDRPKLRTLLNQFVSATRSGSDGGVNITSSECGEIKQLSRPANIFDQDVEALCDRLDRMVSGRLNLDPAEKQQILDSARTLGQTATILQQRGWVTTVDGFIRGRDWVIARGREALQQNGGVRASLFYKVGTIRGRTRSNGTVGCIALAPNQTHTVRVFDPKSRGVSISTIAFGAPGTKVKIPPALFLPSTGSDNDGDGLTDEIEDIIGTNPTRQDSDGDGIRDDAELGSGTDPLDGLPVRTGIIASSDTPGTAVDVCAINDIAIVADSQAGVIVFNVSSTFNPVRIAQVDTPGTALAVSCSGNLIAVADGAEGLAIVDITDPPAARIVRQVSVNQLGGGGSALAVATAADLAFVGTTWSNVCVVELATGTVLQIVSLNGPVQDLAIEGTTLYAYVAGRLHVLPFEKGIIEPAGSVASPGTPNPNAGRGRLFVGNGIAYPVHERGYNTLSVSNPAAPVLLAQGNTAQLGWKQIVLNGSALGVSAVGVNRALSAADNIYLYDTRNPLSNDVFITQLDTPGIARAVSIYNGLAYVADHANGLHVMNYFAYDALGQPPTGALVVSSTNGTITGGGLVVLRAVVADDVQVRNVEFFVNGQRLVLDGSFPFEVVYRVPTNFVGTNLTFTATVRDTGGNSRSITPVLLDVVQDTQPPALVLNSPADNSQWFLYDDPPLRVTAIDPQGVSSVVFQLNGAPLPVQRLSFFDYHIATVLPSGTHRLTAIATDYAGLSSTSTVRVVVLRQANSREITVFNFGPPDRPEAISRELSVFNFGPPDVPEAISREFSVFNFGPADRPEAISRELSVFNFGPADKPEAISREVSVQVTNAPAPSPAAGELRAARNPEPLKPLGKNP